MEIEQVKELGQVAGIAGLAIGAMVTLGRVVLRKVGRLNQKQSFTVVIIWSLGTFVIVGLGIGAWWSTNARAVESASAEIRAGDIPPATVTTQSVDSVEAPVAVEAPPPVATAPPSPPPRVRPPVAVTTNRPVVTTTNRPTIRPVTPVPTNLLNRRVVRREQVLLDLKKPMAEQVGLFNGDKVRVVKGAVDAVAGIDVGQGWKPLKAGEIYEVRSAENKVVVPNFRAKEIRMLTLKLNLVKNAQEAKLLLEVTASSQLDKSRKRRVRSCDGRDDSSQAQGVALRSGWLRGWRSAPGGASLSVRRWPGSRWMRKFSRLPLSLPTIRPSLSQSLLGFFAEIR